MAEFVMGPAYSNPSANDVSAISVSPCERLVRPDNSPGDFVDYWVFFF
jgi:hypothetical protein